LLDDGTTPAAARLSTPDKIEVSEWLEPDGFSIDCVAQRVLKANVRFGSKADMGKGATDVRFTPESGHRALAILRLTTSHSLQMGSSDHRDDRVAFDCIIWEDFN
jgi:hypothetical protein